MGEGVGATDNSNAIKEYKQMAAQNFRDQMEIAKTQSTQAVHQTAARATGESGR
jgi:hypothetical protein